MKFAAAVLGCICICLICYICYYFLIFRLESGPGVKAGTRGCGFGELEVYESKVVVDTYAGKGVVDVGIYIFPLTLN